MQVPPQPVDVTGPLGHQILAMIDEKSQLARLCQRRSKN